MDTNTDTPRDPHKFRENMKKWRKIRGMSQEDLARKITENPPESPIFHQQTIQKIENGNRGISLTDAVLITVALDLDLNTMLTNPDGPAETVAEVQRKLLRRNVKVVQLAVEKLNESLENLGYLIEDSPDGAGDGVDK